MGETSSPVQTGDWGGAREHEKERNVIGDWRVYFVNPPEIGAAVWLGRDFGRMRVFRVEPYVRRDGTHSFVLWWHSPRGIATTGLKSKSAQWWFRVDRERARAA
jgi:hypothetical protein